MMLQSAGPLRHPALSSTARRGRSSTLTTRALFGFGKESESAREKRLEKEEQFRIQQEVLQSRKSGSWKKVRKKRERERSKQAWECFFCRLRQFNLLDLLSRPTTNAPPPPTTPGNKKSIKTKKQNVDTRRAKVSKYLRDPAFKKEIDEERRERLKREAAAEPQRTGFRIIVPINPIGTFFVCFCFPCFFLHLHLFSRLFPFSLSLSLLSFRNLNQGSRSTRRSASTSAFPTSTTGATFFFDFDVREKESRRRGGSFFVIFSLSSVKSSNNRWVDEDADFFKQIGRFFGGGKKKEGGDDDEPKGGKK